MTADRVIAVLFISGRGGGWLEQVAALVRDPCERLGDVARPCAFEPKDVGATFLLAHDMMIVAGWFTPERRGIGRV
jgi:hypothetical protein